MSLIHRPALIVRPQTERRKDPWMPPRAVLRAIQQERIDRLERDYRWLILQRTGLKPRGDWLDILRWEITRWAAPAFVKKGTKTVVDPGTSTSPTLASVVGGDLVVSLAAVARFSTTAAALALPSTWSTAQLPTSIGNQGGYSVNLGLVYKPGATAGTQTAAWTGFPAGGSAAEAIVAEFSGVDTVAPLDANNHNGSGTAGTSGTTGSSGTASQSDVLWIAAGMAENGVNTSGMSASIAGWNTIANDTSDTSGCAWWCGYQIAAVNTAVNPGFNWTSNSVWAGIVAGFVLTGGGPTGGPFPFFTLRQAGMRGLTGGMFS